MTQSPTPTPDPNNRRRRRLTADELIAILVAMVGIGAIFWWSVSHRTTGWNFAQTNNGAVANGRNVRTILPATDNTANQKQLPANNNAAVTASPSDNSIILATPETQPSVAANAPVPSATTGIAAATGVVAALSQPQASAESTPSSSAISESPSPLPAFKDVESHWAKDYITVLRERQILDDFGTGTFDPNLPVTRGEYAKMLDRAFPDRVVTQQVLDFQDIPSTYKRREALDRSVKMGFMTGYPKNKFAPDEKIPRYQMQISLVKGLRLKTPSNVEKILAKYSDASKMPKYARDKMAAAIDAGLVLKDKDAKLIQPAKVTTRGEAAALIYEALVKEGKLSPAKTK